MTSSWQPRGIFIRADGSVVLVAWDGQTLEFRAGDLPTVSASTRGNVMLSRGGHRIEVQRRDLPELIAALKDTAGLDELVTELEGERDRSKSIKPT